MYLSVVIPAYNEEKRLAKTLRSVSLYLQKQNYDSEIIVVSDGSKDRTREVVEGLQGEIPNIFLIANENNHGKGHVVRQGIMASRGEYRVFMDADNATTIDHMEKLWPEFEKGYDVVIGSRDIKGAVLAVAQAWWRRRLGDVFNLIVQVVSGLWGIWDTQCGFKGFSKRAVEVIFPRARINRWAFDVELLVIARKHGLRLKEVPVVWVNNPDSKVKFKGMAKMLFEIFQIRWNMIQGKYA